MSKFHNCATLLDFAALVLSSSLDERMQLLGNFYESRDPVVTEALQCEVFSVGKGENSKRQRRKRKIDTGKHIVILDSKTYPKY